MNLRKSWFSAGTISFLLMIVFSTSGWSQTCSSGSDIAPGTRTAIQNAVTQYFQLAQQGNVTALQQSAAPDFSQIAVIVSENKDAFSGTPTLDSVYVLENPAPANGAPTGAPKQNARSEFFCGIFNSQDRVGFVFPSLPSGQYAVAIQKAKSDKSSYSISWILQPSQNRWLIAGAIPKANTEGGHDGDWFIQQANTYKSKGQMHNAWLFYVLGDSLLRPFPAMSTPQLDRLYDQFISTRPNDLPADENPVSLSAAGKTYLITTIFPAAVGNDIDLVVKYKTADLSDVTKAYNDNVAVINALVTKYPEFRGAFAAVVARAVAPTGQDYGTLLAMKDVK